MSSLKLGRSNRPGLSDENSFKLQVTIENAIENALREELGSTIIVYASAGLDLARGIWMVRILADERFYRLELDQSLEDWWPLESLIAEIKLTVDN